MSKWNYSEYLIEYDNDNLMVYVSGLDKDDFWEDLEVIEDVNNPEEFAEGYAQGLRAQGEFVTVSQMEYEEVDLASAFYDQEID